MAMTRTRRSSTPGLRYWLLLQREGSRLLSVTAALGNYGFHLFLHGNTYLFQQIILKPDAILANLHNKNTWPGWRTFFRFAWKSIHHVKKSTPDLTQFVFKPY